MIALLWLESPSSTCAKLHIVTASNNWDHPMRSLYYCLFTPHIYGFYSSCTSRSWWIAHSTQQCQPRGCNNISFSQRTTPIAYSFCEVCIWQDLHILGTAPSKTLSGKCTKFHTVAASNNRDHVTRSLCYCLFLPHIRVYGCYSSHASLSWWIAHSTQHQQRGCNSILGSVHDLCHMT